MHIANSSDILLFVASDDQLEYTIDGEKSGGNTFQFQLAFINNAVKVDFAVNAAVAVTAGRVIVRQQTAAVDTNVSDDFSLYQNVATMHLDRGQYVFIDIYDTNTNSSYDTAKVWYIDTSGAAITSIGVATITGEDINPNEFVFNGA